MTDFAQLLNGAAAQQPGPQPTAPYAALTGQGQQQSPLTPAPTQDPMVIQDRASRWSQLAIKLQTDPNLQRAMMFAGSAMMQPAQWGDTAGSIIGRGVTTGLSAYNLGEMAQFEQDMKRGQEARATRESDARVAESGARTTGLELENQKKQATLQDEIKRSQILVDKAALELSTAKSQEEIDAVKRKFEMNKAQILASIPDTQIRAQVQAEMEKQGLANSLTRAQTASANASAGYSAEAAKGAASRRVEQDLENEMLKSMTPEERAEFLKKKSGVSKTGKEAEYDVWGRLWDQQNPGNKDAAARSKYIEERMTSAKTKDDNALFLEIYKATGDINEAKKVMQALGKVGGGPGDLSGMPGKKFVAGDAAVEQEFQDKLPEGVGYPWNGVIVYKQGGRLYYVTPEEWKAKGQK